MNSTQNNPRPRKYPEPAAKPNTASDAEKILAARFGFTITRTFDQRALGRRIHEMTHGTGAEQTRWEAMIFDNGEAIIGDGFGGDIGPSFETSLADLSRSLADPATRAIMGF